MTPTKRAPKVQRWMDLITALLSYHYAVPFSRFSRDVPAYSAPNRSKDAVFRMFERDKDDLRSLGFPIDVITSDDGSTPAEYHLRGHEVFLPYLSIVGEGAPRRASGLPYARLTSLVFTPDELDVLVRASRRAQQLGDPLLADEAARALRKFAFDVRVPAGSDDEMVVTDVHDSPVVLEKLDKAVQWRKRASFQYHSMEKDTTSKRAVEPLGLVFMSSAWYLVAHDTNARGIRVFKVRRITNVAVNEGTAQTPDFHPPEDFDISFFANSRKAWELGDGDFVTATVEFTGKRGAVAEAMKLGEPAGRNAKRRKFRVRRVPTFARWLLSFGGEAKPISPPAVVTAWSDLARRTSRVYGRAK